MLLCMIDDTKLHRYHQTQGMEREVLRGVLTWERCFHSAHSGWYHSLLYSTLPCGQSS